MLKDTLEDLPSCTVTQESLGLEGIRLANHVPGKPVALDFQPPEVLYIMNGNEVQFQWFPRILSY